MPDETKPQTKPVKDQTAEVAALQAQIAALQAINAATLKEKAELEARLSTPGLAGDTPAIMADAKARYAAAGGAMSFEQSLQAARAQHNENVRQEQAAKAKAETAKK